MSERRNNGNHRFSNDDCRGKGSKKGGFGRKISGAAYGGGKNYGDGGHMTRDERRAATAEKKATRELNSAKRASSRADRTNRNSGVRMNNRQGFDMKPRTDVIVGRNPVMEALKSNRDMERIMVQEGSGGSVGKIISLAKEQGIVVGTITKASMEELAQGEAHQGVAAIVSAHEYAEVDDIFALAEERGEDPFIIVLDGIEDPHNLGAIMRTAECAGAHGVIIQKRRAVGLTETVAKTSAGAIEYLPCARVANISQLLEQLKEKGLWIYACDMDGVPYSKNKLTGGIAIVIGAEGDGISRLVKEKCDGSISIPMLGHINSLNASNAAAILMYEVRRQRDDDK